MNNLLRTNRWKSLAQVATLTAFTVASTVMPVNALAEKPETMNERQHIANKIRNKIANARLRGMLAGAGANAEVEDAVAGEDSECITQIGNFSLDSGGRPTQQDIIILGDVINVCN